MKISQSFGTSVAVLFAASFASARSHADYVGLPATLDQLLPQGNYTTVGDKTITFLSYSSTVSASSIEVMALSQSGNGLIPPYGF